MFEKENFITLWKKLIEILNRVKKQGEKNNENSFKNYFLILNDYE